MWVMKDALKNALAGRMQAGRGVEKSASLEPDRIWQDFKGMYSVRQMQFTFTPKRAVCAHL